MEQEICLENKREQQEVFRSETGNESTFYFHCASHELNLRLSKASKVPKVLNMVSTMLVLDIFFQCSPKRQRKLEEAIAEADKEGCLKKKAIMRNSLGGETQCF